MSYYLTGMGPSGWLATLNMVFWFYVISVYLLGKSLSAYAGLVVPGAAWTDTSGNVIQAHGGGFLKVTEVVHEILATSKVFKGRINLLLVRRRQVVQQRTFQGCLVLFGMCLDCRE